MSDKQRRSPFSSMQHLPGRPRVPSALVAIGLLAIAGIVLYSVCHSTLAAAPPQSASQGQAPVLRTRHNEVLVRVVVRDSQGKPVEGLKLEDFRLFDNGKPQDIIHFEAEKAAGPTSTGNPTPVGGGTPGKESQPAAISRPERYLLLVLDNAYTPFEGLVRSREAAKKFLATGTAPADRIGLVTTSGDISIEFTNDRKQLESALNRLKPNFHGGNPMQDCPKVSDYEADRAANYNDPDASQFIIAQAAGQGCPFTRPEQALVFARSVAEVYRGQSANSLSLVKNMVRRLASAPGERLFILVSRGFMAIQPADSLDQIIELALRSGVVISALDPEGLTNPSPYTDASESIPTQPPSRNHSSFSPIPNLASLVESMATTTQHADWDILFDLSESTGGRFFHNNNDLNLGFREMAGAPEVSYLLVFSPKNLKLDGKFHRLKVELASGRGFTVTARRGYFAPTKELTASEEADKEIEDTVLGNTEAREIPTDVRTEYYKTQDGKANLAVFIHLDAKALPFRKHNARNDDDLTLVTVLFDRNGNYVDGHRKRMQLRLSDANLAKILPDGIDVRDDFQVAPGTYFVREVVRDSEGGKLSALNTTVDIQF
jgi:VWFA-related protein